MSARATESTRSLILGRPRLLIFPINRDSAARQDAMQRVVGELPTGDSTIRNEGSQSRYGVVYGALGSGGFVAPGFGSMSRFDSKLGFGSMPIWSSVYELTYQPVSPCSSSNVKRFLYVPP